MPFNVSGLLIVFEMFLVLKETSVPDQFNFDNKRGKAITLSFILI